MLQWEKLIASWTACSANDGRGAIQPNGSELLQQFADNQGLPTARAKQAVRVFQDSGVEPSTLTVREYGATRLPATNADEDGQRMNRRVEVRVTPKG